MPKTKSYAEWRDGIREDVRKIASKTLRQIDDAGKRTFREVQQRSRVRTGSFMSNWNFSIDEPDLSYSDRRILRQKTINLRLAAAKSAAFNEKNSVGHDLYMVNVAPYAGILDRDDNYLGMAEDIFLAKIDGLLK